MTSGDADIDDDLLRALHRAGRMMNSRRASSRIAEAADLDLGQQGVQVLRALHRDGRLRIERLAQAADMDKSAVSRQVRALEARELVVRSGSPDDARVAIVTLTSAGKAAAERLRYVSLRHLTEALMSWSTSDRRDLTRLLNRLVDDLTSTTVRPYEASDGAET